MMVVRSLVGLFSSFLSMLMVCFIYLLLHFVLLVESGALVLPDILWDPQNPLFDDSICDVKSINIYAKIGDRLTFLCGHPNINARLNPSDQMSRTSSDFYYNIYLTNNIEVYKSRNGSAATFVYNCKSEGNGENFERYLVYTYSVFLNYFQMVKMPGFQEGSEYWFFTTSDGSKESLKRRVGETSNPMRIRLKICAKEEECLGRTRSNLCLVTKAGHISKDDAILQKQRAGNDVNEFDASFNKPEIYLTVIFAFVLGSIFGVILGYKRLQCRREMDGDRPRVARQVSTNSQMPILKSQQVSPEEVMYSSVV